MIILIKTDANITVDEMDITETSFKSLNLKESHVLKSLSGRTSNFF